MNFSVFALRIVAFSTISKILVTVESLYFFETFILSGVFLLIDPDNTLSLIDISTSNASPVSDAILIIDGFNATPSIGTISPGLTIIISPILTSFGNTTLPSSNVQFVTLRFKVDIIAFLDFSTATP